jgi:hypothetical protein
MLLITIVYVLKCLYEILNALISKFYSILGTDNSKDVLLKNVFDMFLKNQQKTNYKTPMSKKLIFG